MASMDGFGPSNIVIGLQDPRGIAIDFKMSRMYWADKMQSSNLDGSSVLTLADAGVTAPTGIALMGDAVFWGAYDNNQLRSSNKEGTDIRVLHTDTNYIRYLTVLSDFELPQNRTNRCEGRKCSSVGVLTIDSYECVN